MNTKIRKNPPFTNRLRMLKRFLFGVVLSIFGFFFVYAFIIKTDINQAIQYIRETIYTTSGGNTDEVLIHLGTGKNANHNLDADIRTTGSMASKQYCDRDWNNCRYIEQTLTGINLSGYFIPMAIGNTPTYGLTNSQIQQDVNNNLGIGVLPVAGNKLTVGGNISSKDSIYADNSIYVENKIYSDFYCSPNSVSPTCFVMHIDFVQTGYLFVNYYTTGQIDAATGKIYAFITGNYVTTGAFNTLSGEVQTISGDLYVLSGNITNNYWTSGQIISFVSGNYVTTGAFNTLSGEVQTISGNLVALSGNLSANYYTKTQINTATGLIYTKFNDYYTTGQVDTKLVNNITGAGAANYIPKFNSANTLNNSVIYQNGSKIGIGTTTTNATLTVSGNVQLLDQGVKVIGGACTNAGEITFDATNKNFLGCDGSGWMKLNN